MIDKKLLTKRFKQSLKTYDTNALIQNQMGIKLVQLLPKHDFDKVFEFGCGCANLTKVLSSNIDYKELFINDIVEDSKLWAQKVTQDFEFLAGDIETVELPQNLDLITSNATIQWVVELSALLEKFSQSLNKGGLIALTTFGPDNFSQIKTKFGIGLKYSSLEEIRALVSEKFDIIHLEEEKNLLQFRNFRELLSHIKSTGVNCFDTKPMKKSDLLTFKENRLTYHSIYIIARKKDL